MTLKPLQRTVAALASLLLERRADLSTLRSLGMTGRQIAAASAWAPFRR